MKPHVRLVAAALISLLIGCSTPTVDLTPARDWWRLDAAPVIDRLLDDLEVALGPDDEEIVDLEAVCAVFERAILDAIEVPESPDKSLQGPWEDWRLSVGTAALTCFLWLDDRDPEKLEQVVSDVEDAAHALWELEGRVSALGFD